MLIPSWVSNLIEGAYSIVPVGQEIPPLPPLAAYLSAWLYITIILGVFGFLLYPIGATIWNSGYNVTNRVPSGLPLVQRIRTASAGLRVQNIGLTLQKASGIRTAYPDRPVFNSLSHELARMRKIRFWTRMIRSLLSIASVCFSLFDGIFRLTLAAVRPSWLNVARWTVVIVFLNPEFVATASWSGLITQASSLNVPLPTVVALLGLSSLAVGTIWRGGHKWSSKFFETAESKRLEFLNQALPVLGDIAHGLEKRARVCDSSGLYQLGDVVKYMTDGKFELENGGTITAVAKSDRNLFTRGSVHYARQSSIGSSDFDGSVRRLSELHEKLVHEHWDRFLWSRCPARIARLFYNFDFEVQQWGALGMRLSMASINEHARENVDFKIAQSKIRKQAETLEESSTQVLHLTPGPISNTGRDITEARLINWLEEGVRGETERIDDLLTGAAEAIALIRSIYAYAQRQTRASLPKRFLGTR